MGRSRIRRLKWYVFYIEEGDVGKLPAAPGIVLWQPELRIKTLVDGLWTSRSTPLFPGYVFVGCCQGWKYAEALLGIRLLRHGKDVSVLSKMDFLNIHEMEECERFIEPMFHKGQEVMVRHRARSSFAGLVGKFVRIIRVHGGRYGAVEFSLYGEREVLENIPLDYLEEL